MPEDKVQQAITLIHAGNTAAAQRLLADVLAEDPRSEQGWLWLAAAAPPDKRRYCLEKVLSINPNNTQARQMLWPATVPPFVSEVVAAPPSQPTPQPSEPPQPELDRVVPGSTILTPEGTTESAAQVAQTLAVIPPLYWTVPVPLLRRNPWARRALMKGMDKVSVIILGPTHLFEIKVRPASVPVVLNQFNRGALTKEWFEKHVSGLSYASVPLERILRVRLLMDTIKFNYRAEGGKDETAEINCGKAENSDSILAALHKRLGERFTRVSGPTSRWNLAVGAAIILLIVSAFTGFLYWRALALGDPLRHGALLQQLGPNGVLCLGGGMIILLIIGIASVFINPPSETVLIRKP